MSSASSIPTDLPVNPSHFVRGKIVSVDFSASPSCPPYDIVIGHSILLTAGILIKARLGARQCVIVTDVNVGPIYSKRLEAVLAESGHDVLATLIIGAGETSKSFANLQSLLDQMLASGCDRATLLLALGGGVVGDLAGLAASLFMRGLDLVQIPTTLMAQVDSAVGGKTGIDTAFGKNLIGTFHQPRLVISDVAILDSLPGREMRAGYAEIVKYGLICDATFFRWCTTHSDKLLNCDHDAQIQAVGYSCTAKAKIVIDDERELGNRALLNFGHTFGHALEALSGYGSALIHGEAVSIGMAMAFRLSHRLGLCKTQDDAEVTEHLKSAGLPVKPAPGHYDIDRLMAFMKRDKKPEGAKMTVILARAIGQTFISHDVDPREVRAVWEEFVCP